MRLRPEYAHTLSVTVLTTGESVVTTLVPPLLVVRGFDPAAIGLLVAIFPAVALLMRVPGSLAYRVQRARLLMAIALVVSALGSIGYGLTVGATAFVVARALHGVGWSIATTVNTALFVESMPEGRGRGHAVGFYSGGMALGYTLGSLMGGFAGDVVGFELAFVLVAPIWLLALLPLLITDLPPGAAPVRDTGLSTLKRIRQVGGVLLKPEAAAVFLGAFFLSCLLALYNTFVPLLALAHNLSLSQIGLLRGVYSATNALGRPLAGFAVARVEHRRLQNWTLTLQAAMLVPFALPVGFYPYSLFSVGAGAARAVGMVSNTLALADIDPTRMSRGVASGVVNAARDVGMIVTPALGGLLASGVGIERFWLIAPPLWLGTYFAVLALLAWHSRSRQVGETA